mgnify:CR=1 FL=1|tara:strand:- start:1158 stop:1394 length:237 start_codon:yes stop_codon:yes gene_type:complete
MPSETEQQIEANTPPSPGSGRPEHITDEHLTYLDDLQQAGVTNMFGAPAYLQDAFEISKDEAQTITSYWMRTYGQEDR